MKTRRLILLIAAVIAAGAILSYRILHSNSDIEADVVEINEAAKAVEQAWGAFDAADWSAIPYPFAIIDSEGTVLYRSGADTPDTVYEAIRERSTIVDIKINDEVAGKLLLQHEDRLQVKEIKEKLFAVLLTAFVLLGLLGAAYLLYLQLAVFKPFRKLQRFALQVARGNLDLPLAMDKNNLFGAFTESFDIMREELSAARQGEYEANRSKKELVASLSHDIKTPVASIKALSELMLLQATDEKAIRQLGAINAKADQIDLLVTDMFHATLEELQELKVTVSEQSSAILAGMAAGEIQPIRCDPIPECIVRMDPMRLQQVLDNVLSNSYKYAATPISISSRISGPFLELSISDYGPGVGRDELPLLFHKFYRGSNSERHGGSGLGLYLSQYFMKNMDGDIECYNREDGFTVTLKLKLA